VNTTSTRITLLDLDDVNFDKGGGLLPAVVQHADSRAVLMLGYMNREALLATLTHRRVVFFSRSKDRLWEKGETSGHSLELVQVQTDCDRDALLVSAWPRGPVCHTGSGSCFGEVPETPDDPMAFLAKLEEVIGARMAMRPEGSYTAKLLAAGWARIAQKVGEEGLEAALAGAGGSDHEVIQEVSDLLYHVMVMLKARGLSFKGVAAELRARHEIRGLLRPTSDLS
jgi:phosphoribosyl-AMP cyclohydrolase / phosphoribosyl-ATP pyrophosphohydrolase